MKLWALALIFILALGGCQKQSPDLIESDYEDSLSDSLRAESCRNTELTSDLLEASNLKNLFECTKWNEKFPAMYTSLLEMNQESWNYFASPINDKIFNDKNLRDELIVLLNELDRLGGLDELGKVINSLNESNFFENLNKVIICAEDSSQCSSGKIVSKEDLFRFFNLFELSMEDLEVVIELSKSFSLAVGSSAAFPEALRQELKKPDFFSTRLELLDNLMLKVSSKQFSDDLSFYENILNEKSDDGSVWLRSIFNTRILAEDFDYLVFYPIDVQKNLWKDFRLLNVAIQSDLVCRPEGDFNGLRIDVSEHLTAFLHDLFNSSQEKFFEKTIQSVGLIKTATQMCRELSGYKGDIRGYMADSANLQHEIDFVTALTSSSKLLLNKGFYELFRKFQFAHPLGGARELFVLENFSDDFFVSFLRLASVLERGDKGPIYTGHELLRHFDESFYKSLGLIVKWAQSKRAEDFKSLAIVWNGLSEEGKLFFINFFDAHYKNEADVSLLVAYYSSTLKTAKKPIYELLKRFFSRKSQKDENEFLRSLSNVVNVLSAPELLDDFSRFFSREHILEIMKIISRGYVDQVQSNAITDIYILEPSQRTQLPSINLSSDLSRATESCLERMSEPQVNFYSLISVPPVECSSFAHSDPLLKSFYALSDFSLFLSDNGGEGLTREGVLSPVLLNNYVSLFKAISQKYSNSNEDGLYLILRAVNKFFQNSNIRSFTQKLGEGLEVLTRDGGLIEELSAYFGEDENYGLVPTMIEGLEISATLYSSYKKGYLKEKLGPTSFVRDEAYSCNNYHEQLGGRSCPSVIEMNTLTSRLVRRVLKKNEQYPTALEQMIKMISVDHGLKIPYAAESQRTKVVTIKESLEMMYGFSDKNLATNNIELEMQIYPQAIDNFFSTEDWEVTRDQADSELKGVKRKLNTMERVEVVVRDVRFDEAYLGAHYMNSVAKAEDYNKTVDSKFGLLKKCVPLKFCGKFMNKTQHGIAKNSKDAFPALLDANTKNDWRFGDYMQALLTSLVSSSPKVSQVSSVIKKKILGLSINVPYLQTKKQLVDHNGKVLTLVSMVSGFSNISRLIRDRVGRTDEEFKTFLQGPAFIKVNETFLKNYVPERDSKKIASLLQLAHENGFLSSMIKYFSEVDYKTQRLSENIVFKGLYFLSFLSDGGSRYEKLGLSSFLDAAKLIVKHHGSLSRLIDLRDQETLIDLNHFLDVTAYELSRPKSPFVKMLGEITRVVVKNAKGFNAVLESYLQDESALKKIKGSLLSLRDILSELEKRDSTMSVVSFIKDLRINNKVRLGGFKNLLRLSGAKRVCEPSSQSRELICKDNKHRNELGRTFAYLSKERSRNLLGIVDYFGRDNDEDQLLFFLKIFPSLTIY